MKYYKEIFLHNRGIFFILLVYFLLHLINLSLLPIFNDEAIYIDWGWLNIHLPGHLYDSLLDAKQPLMIWLFGIFGNLFSDPLFAGRFVSVLFGMGALVGIYKLTKYLFNSKIAVMASLIYSVVPIIFFYNRQALLESGVACLGIWSGYALLQVARSQTKKWSIILMTLERR